MDEFVDVEGASGAKYRFRSTNPASLPEVAGNFIVAAGQGADFRVICCGSTNSIPAAASLWRKAVSDHQADRFYVHRNIAGRDRLRVHDDISAKHLPPAVAPEIIG